MRSGSLGGRRPAAPWLAPLPDLVRPDIGDAGPRAACGAPSAGLVDEPDLQRVSPLTWSAAEGSWLLAGPAASGRTTAAPAVVLARGCGPRARGACTCTSSTRGEPSPTWPAFRTSALALATTTRARAPHSSGTCAPRWTVASRFPSPKGRPARLRRPRREVRPPEHLSPSWSSTAGTTWSRPSPPTRPTSCPVTCCGCCATDGRWGWSASSPAGGACSTRGGARSVPAPSSSAPSTHWMPRWPVSGPRTCLVNRRPGVQCGCTTGARCSSRRRPRPTRRCSRARSLPRPAVGGAWRLRALPTVIRRRRSSTRSISASTTATHGGSRPDAILMGVGGPSVAPWHWRPGRRRAAAARRRPTRLRPHERASSDR